MTTRAALLLAGMVAACGPKPATTTSTPPSTRPAHTLTFGDAPSTVGTTIVRDSNMVMELAVIGAAEGGELKIDFASRRVERRREEVLAVSDGRASKVRVVYELAETVETGPKGEERRPNPMSGAYIVERVGTELKVARDGGQPLADAEREVLNKDFKRLGQADGISAKIRGTTIAIGQAIEISPEDMAAAGLLGGKGEGSMRIVLSGTTRSDGREQGAFDVAVTMQGPYPDGVLSMQLSGKAFVDLETGWLIALSLGGPLAMQGRRTLKDGRALTMNGTGEMRFAGRDVIAPSSTRREP